MPKVEKPGSAAFYRVESLEGLARLFDGLARNAAGKYAQNPELRRGAVLAFKHAASITRRTIIGRENAES